jgi:hypothetical protein
VTTPPEPDGKPEREGISALAATGFALLGFVIAFILDFALSFGSYGLYERPPSPALAAIVASWVITLGVGWVLYKLNRWALYGMLGLYAALFLLLLASGPFGPYTCFGAYGYPHG